LALASAVVAGTLVLMLAPLGQHQRAGADVTTQSGTTLRDNWDSAEPGLAPSALTSSNFGQLYSTPVGGQVYARPLVWHGTVLVATETNRVAAIDAASGALEWSHQFGTPWNVSDIPGCTDISPTSGITGTPVIDPATGIAYFVTKSYISGDSGPSEIEMHAVDMTSGDEEPGWPVVFQGTASNDPTSTFNATNLISRPSLLLLNGVVYAGLGSLCDTEPFQGWVIGVSTATARLSTLWTTEPHAAAWGAGGSVWQSGSGLVSDGPNTMLLVTGNGVTPPAGGGQAEPPPGDLGNAVARLTVEPDGSLQTTDFFAPADAASLNYDDLDQGSGGIAALPDQMGRANHPHLLVQAGKSGIVYLLDRDNLGGEAQGPGGSDAAVQEFGGGTAPGGGPQGIGQVYDTPAAWPGDGGWLYLDSTSPPGQVNTNGGDLYAFSESVDGSGNPVFTQVGDTGQTLGYGSSSPVVTSDGTTDGSAAVWLIERTSDGASELEAFGTVPVGGTLPLLWSAPLGATPKFQTPTTDSGRVYVGTNNGLEAFGPTSSAPPLEAAPSSFPDTSDGTTSQLDVTVTSTRAVTVTSLSTTQPEFAPVDAPALPVTVPAGGQLTVPVAFSPDQAGPVAGSLVFGASDGTTSAVALQGTGTVPPGALTTDPAALDFGVVVAGGPPVTRPVTFTNETANPETVDGVLNPSAPFAVESAPASGSVVQPGAQVTVEVTYDPPSTVGTASSLFGVTTDQGLASVPLTAATGTGSPELVISPSSADLGAVNQGTPATTEVTVRNAGNTNMTVTASVPPSTPGFTVTDPVAPGTVIPPGQAVISKVTFDPPSEGVFSDSWSITTDDGSGQHLVTFSAEGLPAGVVDSPAQGGWVDNGTATQEGGTLQLTDATTPSSAGSAFFPTPVDANALSVSFTATIGGGSGADGMALVLADPSNGDNDVGYAGGGLGFAGIVGTAVGLDTYPTDFVGIAQGSDPSDTLPGWLAQTTAVPPLRQGSHQVLVTVDNGTITVSIDGTQVLSTAVSLPPTVLVGFSGGDGSLTDAHDVSDVSITTDAGTLPPTALAEWSLPLGLPVLCAVLLGACWWFRRRRRTAPVPALGPGASR